MGGGGGGMSKHSPQSASVDHWLPFAEMNIVLFCPVGGTGNLSLLETFLPATLSKWKLATFASTSCGAISAPNGSTNESLPGQ